MRPYVASFVIPSPQAGVNRQTVTVPNNFHVEEIIANIPADSTIDILDAGNSIFGSRPLGGGVFATSNKRIRFPVPKKVENTSLELIVECSTAPSTPISVVLVGYSK
jgi:hypothetical protein